MMLGRRRRGGAKPSPGTGPALARRAALAVALFVALTAHGALSQDCTWSAWTEWGPCSAPCSIGSSYRNRTQTPGGVSPETAPQCASADSGDPGGLTFHMEAMDCNTVLCPPSTYHVNPFAIYTMELIGLDVGELDGRVRDDLRSALLGTAQFLLRDIGAAEYGEGVTITLGDEMYVRQPSLKDPSNILIVPGRMRIEVRLVTAGDLSGTVPWQLTSAELLMAVVNDERYAPLVFGVLREAAATNPAIPEDIDGVVFGDGAEVVDPDLVSLADAQFRDIMLVGVSVTPALMALFCGFCCYIMWAERPSPWTPYGGYGAY